MTIILDGKNLSKEILDYLTEKLAKEENKPHLAVVLVGEDPASELYVNIKEKTAEKIGIKSTVLKYTADTTEETILNKIKQLNEDASIHAILVQLPLPKHINEQKIIQAIKPQKDVDGFTPENIGRISIGTEPYAYPCTPKGILTLLESYNIEISGKHVVVIGRSNIVGKPMAQMFLNKNATVTICHSYTQNLEHFTKTADILIVAIGKAKFIKKEMIKSGCIIIDAGTSKIEGKTVGDVDFDDIKEHTSFITPVPGGVGPMTIAFLMKNTYKLFKAD